MPLATEFHMNPYEQKLPGQVQFLFSVSVFKLLLGGRQTHNVVVKDKDSTASCLTDQGFELFNIEITSLIRKINTFPLVVVSLTIIQC